jgi:hypothetical protein
MPAQSKEQNAAHAVEAKRLYLEARDPVEGAKDWQAALKDARHVLADALRASDYLSDVEAALKGSGRHMLTFRNLMAPPMSQDQFKLICPSWSKTTEKTGRSVSGNAVANVAAKFGSWRDRFLTRWLDSGRKPTRAEVRQVLSAVSPLIAAQNIATSKRNRLASKQEQSVIELLTKSGWTKLPSLLIDTRAALPEKHFQHKTRFATATAPQEVDIACGLPKTVVLAMECKVTNDETNSVKRINDVLKKASAWKDHWGNFVVTAALLEGVIAPKDVERLIDHDVQVFWSHELGAFANWLESKFRKPS